MFEEGARFVIQANCYIFSASSEYSESLARQMSEKFGADSCICISDPRAFMLAVSAHAQLKERRSFQNKVTYVDSVKEDDYTGVDPFKKQKNFEWQKEFRTFWDGPTPEGGIIIDVPAIIPLLNRLA